MKIITSILSLLLFSPIAFAFSCNDPIPYCKEMQSCEQARYYLNQCNAGKLDRDNDGIPCENVCGKKGKSAKGGKKSGTSGTKSKKSKLTKSKK
ncbi:TPA: excalibur calcium-binding domain-containing protein [Mannheimia haemolytica]